ncbi:MAG: ABC transporter ATP-binding protein, partial [Chitinophagaceae bacterium]|nr:ABC transporter ATP-binding protein [Chitinophagaceae bacterium]
MKQYARIFQYLKAYKGKIVLYFLFTLLGIVFSIVSVGMLMPFLQLIFTGDQPTVTSGSKNAVIQWINTSISDLRNREGNITALGLICLLMITSIILKNLFVYLSYYVLNPLKNKIVNQLREDLYDKILRLPIGFFNEKRKGDLMSRMSNDVGEVEGSVVGTLEGWIRDPMTIIVTLTVLFTISMQLTLFILVIIPLLGLVIGRITKSLKRHSEEVARKNGETFSIIDETLGGLRVIKAFNIEKLLRNKFFKTNEELLAAKNNIAYKRDLASPLSEVLGVLLFTIVLYYGGSLVLKNQ